MLPHSDAAFEHASDDTLLLPNLTFAEFSIGIEASQFGARPGAARGTIVGLSGTKHEILAVDGGEMGGAKKFDVIDLLISRSGDSLAGEEPGEWPM